MNVSRRTALLALSVLVLLSAAIGWLWRGTGQQGGGERAALERTRLALHRQGFKLDVSEFKFAASPEATARAAVLDNAGKACNLLLAEAIDFLPPVGTNAALVMWNEPDLVAESSTNLWADLRAKLDQISLDSACVAALSGPYRSRFARNKDGGISLVGGEACKLPDLLAARTLLALHDRDQGQAWTNLLALTLLVARSEHQPFDPDPLYWQNVSLVRAFGATWQAIQAGGWTDSQLAALQREWQAADFRSGLPEMAAFARADVELVYALQKKQPLPQLQLTLLPSPRQALHRLAERELVARYRNGDRFQDEETLLRVFCDCEEDYRAIEACSTWQEIEGMPKLSREPPEVTNLVAFATNVNLVMTNFSQRSERYAALNERFTILCTLHAMYQFAFQPRIKWLWRMADSETMRRLLVVALALERCRIRQGCYPESLDAMPVDLLSNRPLDFMDGKPLRYRRCEDGRFVLYSVGRDCQDDGGCIRQPAMLWANSGQDHTDLVWPCAASPAELGAELSARQQLPRAQTICATFVPALEDARRR